MATVSQVLPRVKVALLQGKRISHIGAEKRWGTNRLSEYISRLRKRHMMDIITEIVYDKKGKKSYGVYYLNKRKHESRKNYNN